MRALRTVILGFCLVASAMADTYRDQVRPFLESHCIRCHGAKKQKGDLRLDNLSADFNVRSAAGKWIEVMDNLNLGEMPPEGEQQPDAEKLRQVAGWIASELRAAQRRSAGGGGRILLRRLNRMEYANTIRDLLHLLFLPGESPARHLPPDATYDTHLGRILGSLEKAGQLDNTLIVATSDHGMPFPRCKGQAYEYSNHIPLAIRWPKGVKGQSRVIDDFVDFTAIAPTFLEAAGVKKLAPIMQPISGESLFDIFRSAKSGQVTKHRDHVVVGKERHDVGRPNKWGYPIRGIVTANHLYLRNFEPDRWPIGNPETGYLNCDGSPIKTLLLNQRRNGDYKYWTLNFGKRPPEEIYDLRTDNDCVKNLAEDAETKGLRKRLAARMSKILKQQGDPRVSGRGEVFEQYGFAWDRCSNFYEKYMTGEKIRTGWVNADDFEPERLD